MSQNLEEVASCSPVAEILPAVPVSEPADPGAGPFHAFPPVNPRFPYLWHGGDYNPDQWFKYPGTVDEDFRLFKEAGVNAISLGIFSWAHLEPEEGVFTFDWMDDIFDRAQKAGVAVILATPSGGKPNWLAHKYPEVRRMSRHGNWAGMPPVREEQHLRHNHCYTSPVYRQKVAEIDRRLAERYGSHPALAMWHISNEFGGECHCPLCYAAFREWLQAKYKTLDALNEAWWTGFWSHRFQSWDQITTIDTSIEGLALDWRRFCSDRTIDFCAAEAEVLRKYSPGIPVTTNMMGFYPGYDSFKMAKVLDVISWDCYPRYHDQPNTEETRIQALAHVLNRGLKDKPFILMESSPGPVNWAPVNRLLRPGQHLAKSLQAVAHGSDSVLYFQIRKGRGGSEKFHAAVIDHCGAETPKMRMFQEVQQVSKALDALKPLAGAYTPARAALVYDWESRWALELAQGPSNVGHDVGHVVRKHFDGMRRHGICVDVIPPDRDFSRYELIVLPSLYLLQDGFADKCKAFVEKGGTLVATYLTGIVNSSCLTFQHGFPGDGLRELFGVWDEEIDYLYPEERNEIIFASEESPRITGTWEVRNVCSRIHAENADVIATYGKDFYAGEPAVTCRKVGKGQAWYFAADCCDDGVAAFYAKLIDRIGIPRLVESELPTWLDVSLRVAADGREYLFLINPTKEEAWINLGAHTWQDAFTGEPAAQSVHLGSWQTRVLVR